MSEMALTAGICKTATEEPAFIGKRENVGLGDMGQGVDHNYLYNKYIYIFLCLFKGHFSNVYSNIYYFKRKCQINKIMK